MTPGCDVLRRVVDGRAPETVAWGEIVYGCVVPRDTFEDILDVRKIDAPKIFDTFLMQ